LPLGPLVEGGDEDCLAPRDHGAQSWLDALPGLLLEDGFLGDGFLEELTGPSTTRFSPLSGISADVSCPLASDVSHLLLCGPLDAALEEALREAGGLLGAPLHQPPSPPGAHADVDALGLHPRSLAEMAAVELAPPPRPAFPALPHQTLPPDAPPLPPHPPPAIVDAIHAQAELHRQLEYHMERTRALEEKLRESGRKLATLQAAQSRTKRPREGQE